MTHTMLDLLFPVKGKTLAWDHSYDLYGSLCRRQPLLHQEPYPYGIFPINGLASGNRRLELTDKSVMRMRIPADRIGDILPLVGAALELNGDKISLDSPRLEPIQTTARLFSPWVTYDGAPDEETFSAWVNKELERLEITANPVLAGALNPHSKDGGKGSRASHVRRTRSIKGHQIVGFALLVEGLSAQDSAKLCTHGLGGRRHFGGGLFLPARGR